MTMSEPEKKSGSNNGGLGCLVVILLLMFINGCFRGCGY